MPEQTPASVAGLRALVLATADPQPMPLDVPGWPGVHLRPLRVGDVDSIAPSQGEAFRTARNLARMLCAPDGTLLFDPTSDADLAAINALPARHLAAINAKVEATNANTTEEAAALGNG